MIRIPQQDPIRMVDNISVLSQENAVATLRFTADKYVSGEAALIEHAAQSCAALLGERTGEGRKGYLGEVKSFLFHALPVPDDELRTEITILAEFEGTFLVSARICRGEELLAEGQLKLFVG